MHSSKSELLTVDEFAAFLRVKPATIRDWVLRRRIPSYRVGRLVRLKRADAEALIEDGFVPAYRNGHTR